MKIARCSCCGKMNVPNPIASGSPRSRAQHQRVSRSNFGASSSRLVEVIRANSDAMTSTQRIFQQKHVSGLSSTSRVRSEADVLLITVTAREVTTRQNDLARTTLPN